MKIFRKHTTIKSLYFEYKIYLTKINVVVNY